MLTNTGVSFARPEVLLLLLLLVPLAIYLSRTSMALLRRATRRFSLGLRIVIIVLLVLALAGLEIVRATDRLSVVFLLDRSDSIAEAQQARQADYVRAALKEMGESDAAGVIAFGAEALVDRPVLRDATPPDLASAPDTSYSNIADAIRLGLAVAPADTGRRLVVMSDGRENAGSAEWAARLAGANGVPVDVVSLPALSGPEVWVDRLEAPTTVRENERVSLQVAVQSSADTTATLTISVDGAALPPQQVRLVRGANNFVQTLPPVPRGFHAYSVQVNAPAGADTRTENNRYSAYSVVLGKPRLLIVERQPGEGDPLREALAPSMDAEVVPPSGMPADVRSLAGYEGVVLVNVPASSLSLASMESLQVAVRDLGKGLIVIGGDESYAAGGYFRTPLEQMLPVDLNLPSKLNIPSVGMVTVIDRSGSMGMGHSASGAGVTKLELAKEAASRAVAQLSDRDYVGVITFDDAANWAVPMQRLGDPALLKERIGGITVGGGTTIYAGLAPAVDALIESKAKSKHIILLTDGVSAPGDYDGLLKKMAANGITLSGVAVGADADQRLMTYLAQEGKGRYYYTEDGNALPEIFARESHFAARSYIIEHPFSPERTSPSPILDGLGGLPPLQGYVGTSPRAAGQVVLVSDAGDPVLAQWQYGLGRVVAWTSDAKGQWAREWVGWQEFPRFWSQAVRWTTGTEAGSALQPRVQVEAGSASVTVDATSPSGAYLNDLTANAVVVAPDLTTATLPLRQSAAGRYEGRFPVGEEGVYVLRIDARGKEIGSASQTLGVVVPYSPEYRGDGGDEGLLGRIASLSGGRVLTLDDPKPVFDHNFLPVRSATPLWPLLLLFAILLLPFDIGVRRVAVSRADVSKALRGARNRLGLSPRRLAPAGGGASTPEMAALFGAKERTRERVGGMNALPADPPVGRARGGQDDALALYAPAQGQGPVATPNAGARDLQLGDRVGRTAVDGGSTTSSSSRDELQQPDASGQDNTLAARLRKAREERR